jgi:hypothetical protein
MRPTGGKDWTAPSTKNSNAAAQVATPDFELDMDVSNRAGYGEYSWAVVVTPSKKVSALLTGDRVSD